jgi:hypothetical protein
MEPSRAGGRVYLTILPLLHEERTELPREIDKPALFVFAYAWLDPDCALFSIPIEKPPSEDGASH